MEFLAKISEANDKPLDIQSAIGFTANFQGSFSGRGLFNSCRLLDASCRLVRAATEIILTLGYLDNWTDDFRDQRFAVDTFLDTSIQMSLTFERAQLFPRQP